MYQVIKYFTDMQDNHHPYNVGDVYPREGMEATPERIEELSTNKNKQGEPLIKFVEEQAEPKKQAKRSVKKAAEK